VPSATASAHHASHTSLPPRHVPPTTTVAPPPKPPGPAKGGIDRNNPF
jgi:hypothetical protein